MEWKVDWKGCQIKQRAGWGEEENRMESGVGSGVEGRVESGNWTGQ